MNYNIKLQAEKFVRAMENKNIEEVSSLLANDVVFEDVPMGAHHGKEAAVNKVTNFFSQAESMKWDIQRFIASGNTVFIERTNHVILNNKNIKLPMLVILEFNEQGLIKIFKDYFDLKTLENQLN